MRSVALDPGNRAARGLLGQVSYRGEWLSPGDFQAKQQADAGLARKLEAYHARRAQLDESLRNKKSDGAGRRKAALEHEKLAAWCEEQGLKDQATAHYTTAIQFNPSVDAPWKHLGYVKRRGQWMTREQSLADEQEAAAEPRQTGAGNPC